MSLEIPGGDILTGILNVISQSLTIPVIVILIIFVIMSILLAGGLISEITSRKKTPVKVINGMVSQFNDAKSINELKSIIDNSDISSNIKDILNDIISNEKLSIENREIYARKLIEAEQDKAEEELRKTDIITRIGPTLGLMGTLIPMGPGLAALGAGDVNTLANAIIVAFDTTVVGIGAGAVGYFVSKIRRRWYEEDLSNSDALADALLDKLNR